MCKCKVKEIAKLEYMKPGKCTLKKGNFLCLACKHKNKKFFVHDDSGDYIGYSYECANCREFVRYKINNRKYKDEFYFKELNGICSSLEKNNLIVFDINGDKITSFLNFKWKNKESLLKKIQTILTFS